MTKFYRGQTVAPAVYARAVEDFYGALSPEQSNALYEYTECGYASLNDALYGHRVLGERDANLCAQLDDLLANPHALGVTRLYRASDRVYGPISKGAVLPFAAYISATSDPHQLFNFFGRGNSPIVFEFHTAQGQPVSALRTEAEFLLPRGKNFLVEDVHERVEWHAEYGDTGFSRSMADVTVVQMVEV